VGTQLFNRAVLELSDLVVSPAERELLARVFAETFRLPGLDTLEKLEREARETLPRELAAAREGLAELRGRQLPGADVLARLVTALEAAVEPELPAGRLKELAAQAGPAGMGQEPIVAAARLGAMVRRLREQGRLDLLAAIRRRATEVYPAWDGPAPALEGELAVLRAQATSEALLTQADQAVARDAQVFDAYAAAYRERHARRHARATEALERVQAHPAWPRVEATLQERLRRTILELDCGGAAGLAVTTTPDGRCPECRAGIAELRTHLELLETRAERALAELGGVGGPSPGPEPPGSLVVELRSAADLPRLYEEIARAAAAALRWPRRVRVLFEEPERS
jgi:hypothetical protein